MPVIRQATHTGAPQSESTRSKARRVSSQDHPHQQKDPNESMSEPDTLWAAPVRGGIQTAQSDEPHQLNAQASARPAYTTRPSFRGRSGEDHVDPWTECADVIQRHHKALLDKWTSEIDTLLVYAGLFSAVLTAFNVESYKMLRQDLADTTNTTNTILARMSAQLNSFSINPSFANSTQPFVATSTLLSFHPTTPAVIVNALWFSSLVCSLSAATAAMIVKQWLRENELGLSGTSRDYARRRQYRYNALVKWRVNTVIASLPIILQLASALFLAGLLVLLWTLHHLVAIVASIPFGVLVLFVIVTTVGPTLYLDCAYRSPLSLAFYFAVQTLPAVGSRFFAHDRSLFTALDRKTFKMPAVHKQWAGMERIAMSERGAELDQYALQDANALMLDEHFTDRVIRPCLRSLPKLKAHNCFRKIRWDQHTQTNVDFNTESAVNIYTGMALDIIEPYLPPLGTPPGSKFLDDFAGDLCSIPRTMITAKTSVRLFQVLAKLLRSSTASSNCTSIIWATLDDLCWMRLATTPRNRLITCDNPREVVSAMQKLVLVTGVDVLTQIRAHCQLTTFLATCHIVTGFSPTGDGRFVKARLLEELDSFKHFLGGFPREQLSLVRLGQKTDHGWFVTRFPEVLVQIHKTLPGCIDLDLVYPLQLIVTGNYPGSKAAHRTRAWDQILLYTLKFRYNKQASEDGPAHQGEYGLERPQQDHRTVGLRRTHSATNLQEARLTPALPNEA